MNPLENETRKVDLKLLKLRLKLAEATLNELKSGQTLDVDTQFLIFSHMCEVAAEYKDYILANADLTFQLMGYYRRIVDAAFDDESLSDSINAIYDWLLNNPAVTPGDARW